MKLAELGYTNGHLDRASALRQDPKWIAGQLQRPDTLVVPYWRDRSLISGLGSDASKPKAVLLPRDSATCIEAATSELVFLGRQAGTSIFAADLSGHEKEEAHRLAGPGDFINLRHVGPMLDAREAALLAYARGILYWHRNHKYCGRCGESTESHHGGHMRRCNNSDCARDTFPRTDPAVIMLVESSGSSNDVSKCLLGRHSRLPTGVDSTLAGFVEPGENLEEAVAREVLEETGISVQDVLYQGSQPWPFPASIMLGFRARAMNMDIKIAEDELEDARWFTAEEIAEFGEWGDETGDFLLPRKDSIARFLVESWMAEVHTGR